MRENRKLKRIAAILLTVVLVLQISPVGVADDPAGRSPIYSDWWKPKDVLTAPEYTFSDVGETVLLPYLLGINGIYGFIRDAQVDTDALQLSNNLYLKAVDYFKNATLTVTVGQKTYTFILHNPGEGKIIPAGETVTGESGSFTAASQIPVGTQLVVGSFEPTESQRAAIPAEEGITQIVWMDIGLQAPDGADVHAGAEVLVKTNIELPAAPERDGLVGRAVVKDARLYHVTGEETLEELPVQVETANGVITALRFATESFSGFALSYTVDFEYGEAGETYEFSLPGGGFVTLRQLAEALGVRPNEEQTMEAFLAEIENVTFSDPSLVWVGKVDTDSTVGEVKAAYNLACEYSAELTEEQIAEINAAPVPAGEWLLISLKPFLSEETLTVTMKDGEVWTVSVTDAQIVTNVLTSDGERFRITVTYEDDAMIPDGSVLLATEILEGTEAYERYLAEAEVQWEADERESLINYARFFDLEIQFEGKIVEPQAPVEVEIVHEDGFTLPGDESLSVIHFAENGTEIIDEVYTNKDGTEIIYEQNGFSVIGTVSTVKDSGWPTANTQYVLVLQDGEDYYALKQDGTLTKVRFFNNTVSFIGEGTTTTDYIHDYLWYVVSSGARGKISDKYTEYNASPDGQTFIDPYSSGIFSGTSRQLQIRDGKIYCNGQLPGSSGYTQVTLSAADGQLSRVALTSDSASPILFATASSFTANENETDLFTQEEVELIVDKWKEQKTQKASTDKTAEVYDYENRVYRVDITASSSDYEISPSIAVDFVVDASRSMFFPTSVTQVGTFSGTNASGVRNWINSNGNTDQVYFVIQDKNGKATQYAIFYDPESTYTNYGRTYKGQWLWVDASNYNPPDDIANGGNKNSRTAGNPLSSWNYDTMDDGKIYTTGITGTSDGTYGTRKKWVSRIEYLKQCVRVAAQVIYAVDEGAQIGLVGFNKNIKDYGTFGKSEQNTLINNINNISLDGGTNHQGGLQTVIDKYKKGTAFYAEHYAGRKHVVVLVTDGAPNATGVTWDTIGRVANALKNQEDDFGNKTELYTMGLSLSNVGSNQSNLFNISSGAGYTYAGEDAAQIVNAVTKMVDAIFVQAHLIADVTDIIDPAFYPVNRATGMPLAENDWIDLNGTKVNAGANDAAGQIKKDASTGNWSVEWKNQSIEWPTTDSNGAVVEPGWHGTVFVKAKEDFLGGNGISTNTNGSQLHSTKYIVKGETQTHDLPEGAHTVSFETPYVNVDELDITKNESEWTVYLGTNVDPLAEVKALCEKVKVKEVVTKTDSDHRVSSDGSLTYTYASNTNDNRPEVNGREEFSLSELGITLTDADWNALISGQSRIFDYNAYGHSKVGTIMISLTQNVKTGEKNLTESPHDTTVTGDEVEKYTLTVSYRPTGANITDWHTGSFGSGMSGSRAGNILKDNVHIINVYAKPLEIEKIDESNNRPLAGATFKLYREDAENGAAIEGLDSTKKYAEVATATSGEDGIARFKHDNEDFNLVLGETYYLIETAAPPYYVETDKVWTVKVEAEDGKYTDLDNQSISSKIYPFNWDQDVKVLIDETPAAVVVNGETEGATTIITDGSYVSHEQVVSFRYTIPNTQLSTSIEIPIHKTLKGRNMEENEFAFVLQPIDIKGVRDYTNVQRIYNPKANANVEVEFNFALEYTTESIASAPYHTSDGKAVYYYVVYEEQGNVANIEYSQLQYIVKVTLWQDGNQLKTKQEYFVYDGEGDLPNDARTDLLTTTQMNARTMRTMRIPMRFI